MPPPNNYLKEYFIKKYVKIGQKYNEVIMNGELKTINEYYSQLELIKEICKELFNYDIANDYEAHEKAITELEKEEKEYNEWRKRFKLF